MHLSGTKYMYTKKAKTFRKVPQQSNILVGNYRLRRGERWENIPRVSSKVGEI